MALYFFSTLEFDYLLSVPLALAAPEGVALREMIKFLFITLTDIHNFLNKTKTWLFQ